MVRNFLENRIIRICCFPGNGIKIILGQIKSSFEEMLLKYKLLKIWALFLAVISFVKFKILKNYFFPSLLNLQTLVSSVQNGWNMYYSCAHLPKKRVCLISFLFSWKSHPWVDHVVIHLANTCFSVLQCSYRYNIQRWLKLRVSF